MVEAGAIRLLPTERRLRRSTPRNEIARTPSLQPLRRRGGIFDATTGHVAIHVDAGADGAAAARSKLVGGQASLTCDSRSRVGRWGSPTCVPDSVEWRMQAVCDSSATQFGE
jgi:hypothetical protein